MSKTKARQLAAEMNKLLGGPVVRTGSDPSFRVSYLPTDLLPIDMLLQGGIPRGRFVTITGAYSTLKTYIGLHAIAATQRRGGLCALIDTEHAFDPEWAVECGVDVESLILQHPDTGELGVEAARLMTLNAVDLIVFDSIAAALPKQEQSRRMDKDAVPPGAQGRLMSAACRQLTAANTGKTAFIWINQLREQIGVTFGPTERAPGGRAMGYYASMIVNIRKSGKVTRDVKVFTGDSGYKMSKVEIGQTFRAVVEKSKLNQPFREIFFDFRLEDPIGLDLAKYLFAQGYEMGLVSKRGNTWSYGGLTAGSREKFLAALGKNPEVMEALEDGLRSVHNLPSLNRPGRTARPSKRAASSSAKSSSNKAAVSTPTRVLGGSSGTGLRRRVSSK